MAAPANKNKGLVDRLTTLAAGFSDRTSFANGEYLVRDPSFDHLPIADLIKEFSWFRERVVDIHEGLTGGEKKLVPATEYLELLEVR